MKCPRCGADNAERAEWCYLCEYPFAPGAGVAEPPAPDESVQAQYGPPGAVPPGQQTVPPPPTAEAYQPPPPGAYPAGYQPPPPASKGPVTIKVVVMILVVVVGLIVAIGAYFLLRSDLYKIEVPTPPGFEVAGDDLVDDLKETMDQESKVEIDYLFTDATASNFVIVARQDIPSTFSSDAPPSDDPEAMEQWFNENKDEWVDAFKEGVALGGGMSSDLDLYQVERLATGDAVLHMAMTVAVMNTPFFIETLWVVKGDTAFFILIEGLNKNPKTVEFLKENVTFKK